MIVDNGNDYLIGLKQNQPTLYKAAQNQSLITSPLSCASQFDSSHSRDVTRTCQVFLAPESLQKKWAGIKTFVVVERFGERTQYPNGVATRSLFHERHFFICSQVLPAQEFLVHIQGHWGIENKLHWVKDVHFQEDFPLRRGGNAPINWAILNNFFITIARFLGYRTIPQAQRILSNQLNKVFSLLV